MTVDEKQKPKNPVEIRFTLQVRIGGHAGPLEIKGQTVGDVVKMVRLMEEAPGLEIVEGASSWQYTPEGLPICPRHNIAMRKREKQGDAWHSHNVGGEKEEIYCRGYRGKDSPGWDR